MENVNLTDHFLIAMPNMADPFFAKTLTYICEHNERGALGLVINRPTDLTLEKLFDQLGIPRIDALPDGLIRAQPRPYLLWKCLIDTWRE